MKDDFNHSALGGFLMFAFQTVVIGLLVGGILDFTLFHNHPMGQAIIGSVNEPLLSFYDGIAKLFGFSHLARNTELSDCGLDLMTGLPVCG